MSEPEAGDLCNYWDPLWGDWLEDGAEEDLKGAGGQAP